MNRRGEKRVGAGWEKPPSFTKISRKMNQHGEQIIVIYIWNIDRKGYMHLENQAFSIVNLGE